MGSGAWGALNSQHVPTLLEDREAVEVIALHVLLVRVRRQFGPACVTQHVEKTKMLCYVMHMMYKRTGAPGRSGSHTT